MSIRTLRQAPRRVLMTADTIGGVWNYALELARALAPFGTEVTLATMGRQRSRSQVDESTGVPGLEVRESTFALEWMPDPWDDVARAGNWLLDLERELGPDVVHLNGYAHAALPWSVPVLVVAHSCVLSWWKAVKGHEAPAEWHRYRDAVAAGLRAADLVAAPSFAMRDALVEHYGAAHDALVIPNARRADEWVPARPKQPFVFSAGRLWDEAKNLRALDAAAARVPWPVFVAGDTRTPHDAGVASRHAHALGPLAPRDLARWMSRAAIYALPARYEPFGLSVLEAALSECALVLGDIPSLRELWRGAAVFVAPGDEAALARALGALAAHPHLRTRLARLARQRAFALTPERQRDGYLAAYGMMAGRDGKLEHAMAADSPRRPGLRDERNRGSGPTTGRRGS